MLLDVVGLSGWVVNDCWVGTGQKTLQHCGGGRGWVKLVRARDRKNCSVQTSSWNLYLLVISVFVEAILYETDISFYFYSSKETN